MKPFFLNDAQGVLVFRLDKQCCLLLFAMDSALPCFYVYCDSEVLIRDRNATVNGKVQELAELKPLPAVEEPTAAVEGVKELWEGEEYEPDHSLSADRTYLKFKKKLDLNPEQCYRYCFGAQPLWAREVQQQPGPCAACGGPRVYEMQLMPPLLYFLQQAYKDLPPSSYATHDWEWSTVIVFSCAQSCSQGAGDQAMIVGDQTEWIAIKEATILQTEV
jgi:pre-rRNA-processing protein TSR4